MESLAAAVRRLADDLVRADADDDTIDDLVRAVDAVRVRLGAESRPRDIDSRMERFIDRMAGPSDDVEIGQEFISFLESPFSGTTNALAPADVVLRRTDDGVEATVIAGPAYEGAPGRAHGGFVAAIFDDVMGAVQRFLPYNGYTRTLSIEYRRPFPLETPASIRAGLIDADETLFTVEATAEADGQTIATAVATFTRMDNRRFAERAIRRPSRNGA